ncbi:pilus assembly protein TadG-related protein [Methylobacillus gramineus]|uniref:TadG family pilus assembly protein n=1 Tax=Methylobacillus gramineus TaxID=755169 RepID=UPI001D000D27|nr:TadG family pilus assembly protein [Methylobacillus gramineus]MCB5184472.1 pilus assembly protein TadG-related protein [Methylobacillus gramineus]
MNHLLFVSRHNQRGAIGLFGVIILMLAVLFTALVVDSGRLWMLKRHLQHVADMAAIEAGRQVGGCLQNNQNIQTLVHTAAQNTAVANGYKGNLAQAPNRIELGSYQTGNNGLRVFTAGSERRAVHVVATQQVPASLFAGGIYNQQVLLRAEAVGAIRTPWASFHVGSTLVSLNTSDSALLNSLLGRVLGTNINLSLASYQGLANSNIKLMDLVKADPTIGSVSKLLDTSLGINQVLNLIKVAVTQQGSSANPQVLAAVTTLATAAVNQTKINLGNVIKVSNPDLNSVAATSMSLLSLINTAVMLANGNNFIQLPLGISLLGIANISTNVQVIQLPQIVIGPPTVAAGTACTVARTAQVRTETSVQANVLGLAKVDLVLRFDVAPGRAELREIRTLTNGKTQVGIDAYPGLAALRLTNSAGNGPSSITLLLGLIPLAEIGLNVPLTQPAPSSMTFNVDHPVLSHLPSTMNSYSGVGQSLSGFATEGHVQTKLLGLDLGGVLDKVVKGLVLPLLTAVTTTVLDPLLKMLGINTAGITVILDEIHASNAQSLLR